MTFPWLPHGAGTTVRAVILLGLSCLSTPLFAQPASAGMERLERTASRTGATYAITVIIPDTPPPPDGYPVIYALDGAVTAPLIDEIRDGLGDEDLRSTVVIGIGYGEEGRNATIRRYHDLTPLTPLEQLPPMRNGHPPPSTGGRDDFLSFLENDLMPDMERTISINQSRRTLFGHSLSGHFALHVLFSRPGLFQTYAVSDPSVWWNARSILQEQAEFIRCAAEQRCTVPDALFIAVAGEKEIDRTLNEGDAARLAQLRAGETGREVAAALSAVAGFRVELRELRDQTHADMLPYSIYRSLLFLSKVSPAAEVK